ncbi:hypothetical protein ACLOJK_035579 [Asimina triloba]
MATDSGKAIAGRPRVALVYDERMCSHADPEVEDHPESPERIRAVWRKLESGGITQRCDLAPVSVSCVVLNAKEAKDSHIRRVHTQKHINLIRNISSKDIDPAKRHRTASKFNSIYFNEGSSEAAYLAAGSVIEAVLVLMPNVGISFKQVVERVAKGEFGSAVAIVRPPGHHAETDEAMGFCLFNNVAIAASLVVNERPELGIKKILIVDWDVHHGNGTQKMFWKDPRVLFFSVHRFDFGTFYPTGDDGSHTMVGEGTGAGYNINVPWEHGRCGDADYLAVWDHVLIPVAKAYNPDMVLISGGFDAAAIGDPLGGCRVTPYGYSVMMKKLMEFAKGRIVMALEGGYNLESLANSVLACVEVLLDGKSIVGSSEAYPFESTWRVIKAVRQELGMFWPTLNEELPSIAKARELELDLDATLPSPEREPSETLAQAAGEDAEVEAAEEQGPIPQRCADPGEARASARHGVLGATFGKTSSCSARDKLFRRPFDVEEKALKILGDLLHDKEGRWPVELMLLVFLPDMWRELMELEERICLVDGCASQAEYRYHVLREPVQLSLGRPRAWDLFGMSRIMSKECQRVVAVGKRLEEAGVAQVTREVLRPNASFSFIWKYMEDVLSEARRMAGEKVKAEGEQCWAEGMVEGERLFFFQLLEMGWRANRAKALQEQAEKVAAGLLEGLGAATLELGQAKEATTELQEETSSGYSSRLGVKEAELSTKLESLQAEITRLQVELEVPQAESWQGAGGDAGGQVLGPASGEHRALVISEYLHHGSKYQYQEAYRLPPKRIRYGYRDTHQRMEEFMRSYYAQDCFVKALSEVATLYPMLDLSSLRRPRVNFARGALAVTVLALNKKASPSRRSCVNFARGVLTSKLSSSSDSDVENDEQMNALSECLAAASESGHAEVVEDVILPLSNLKVGEDQTVDGSILWRPVYSKISIWYASYGSNMWKPRFICYIEGGQSYTQTWGAGGVAFLHPESSNDNRAYICMYEITLEQFNDLLLQENRLDTDVPFPLFDSSALDFVINNKSKHLEALKDGWYSNVVYLGMEHVLPILTMTCPLSAIESFKNGELPLHPPSKDYSKTLVRGLVEGKQLSEEEAINYIHSGSITQI